MIIDVHCHYTWPRRPIAAMPRFSFEPAEGETFREGAGEFPADFDSCVSPRAMSRFSWRAMRRLLGVAGSAGGAELNQSVDRFYHAHLQSPGPVERIVLLAFDAYHDNHGRRTPLPQRASQRGSDIYTSNSLVRQACAASGGRFLFGASVHPYRERASECIREVFAAGAALLKWLPLHQNIDARDPRTISVMRQCAALGLPLLVHYSEEFTLRTQHPDLLPLAPLLGVLRDLHRAGQMPTTIVAHAATPVTPFGETQSHRLLLEALRGDLADAPLYADLSALLVPGKIPFLLRLAKMQDLHSRFLFGSDFPVPLVPLLVRPWLGRDYARVAAEPSWIQRYALVYRSLRFNEIVMHRAETLLPNVHHFDRAGQASTA